MLSQIDDKGHHFQLLSNITDHKSDGNEIYTSDGFTESRNRKIFTQKYHGWMETTSGVEGWINMLGFTEISKGLKYARIGIMRNQ